MAEFLTATGTSGAIERIIKNAGKNLILISPYLQFSQNLFKRLKSASERGVKIYLIFREEQNLPIQERNKLLTLEGFNLYKCKSLHAKCYHNQEEMVITSMNLYEFSERNNWEMGILLTKVEDQKLFSDVEEEIRDVFKDSEKLTLNNKPAIEKVKVKTKFAGKENKKKKGYCIRCEEKIKFNISRPYCIDCFEIWDIYGDPYYEEEVCHACGDGEFTSMNKPLCYSCYKKLTE